MNKGRTRSTTNVRMKADRNSRIIEVLRPNDPVEIRGEAEQMLEVVANRLLPPINGYVNRTSVAKRIPRANIFSLIKLDDGSQIEPVPKDLLAVEFESWLKAKGEPPWLFEDGNTPYLVGDRMRGEFEPHRDSWNQWFAGIVKNNRTQKATMHEWFTVVSGGMNMWSFRAERIFKSPTESSAALGWVVSNDILLWTGRVHYNEREWKYKLWYEVELTKLDRTLKGWYKAALLEEFIYPEVFIEAGDRAGIASLFDMTKPKLRLPTDPQIEEARIAKRRAYQYINVRTATGRNKINHNLCGQFCIAALSANDVIPVIKKWYDSGERPKAVINGDQGTVIYDMQQMLAQHNLKSEEFRPEPSIAPATPTYLEKMLGSGKKGIINVGLTYTGEVSYNGSVRHWIVLEDIVRMGNAGWVRIYNSYFNQEEVYPYQRIFNTGISTGIGLWVDVPDYGS